MNWSTKSFTSCEPAAPGACFPTIFLPGKRSTANSEPGSGKVRGGKYIALCGNLFGSGWAASHTHRHSSLTGNRSGISLSRESPHGIPRRGPKKRAPQLRTGKKIKGRKRHILTDAQGLLVKVKVRAADIQDRDGARLHKGAAKEESPRMVLVYADGGYQGKLVS